MIVLNLLLVSIILNEGQTNPLGKYRWKNRIVIFYSSEPNEYHNQQLDYIQSDLAGFKDRDLLVFRLSRNMGKGPKGNELSTGDHTWLMKKYISKNDSFLFLLIGKDGGVKLKSYDPVANDKLFGLIDGMPIRIQEMKQNK